MKISKPTTPKPKKTRDERAVAHYENDVKLTLQNLLTLLNPEDGITWGGYSYREIVPYAHDFLTVEREYVESGQDPAKQPAQTALEL